MLFGFLIFSTNMSTNYPERNVFKRFEVLYRSSSNMPSELAKRNILL